MDWMKLFFLVFARDKNYITKKIKELEDLNVPYLIVCGEHINHPNVVYRAPKGKYDAINFGAKLIPKNVDIVVMNDVDTKIHDFHSALQKFNDEKASVLFDKEMVREGPQSSFFSLLNPIRKIIPLAGSGELMLIKHDLLDILLPLRPCKAEDTYLLFKALELRQKVIFFDEYSVETERPKTAEEEEAYKRRTVSGIYQALSYTKPPIIIRLFYILLPIMSPLLLVLGKKGYYWMKGILLGLIDYKRGDRCGFWEKTY